MAKGEAARIEKTVIERLKAERMKQNMSYGELAQRTGLHRTALSLIERGERHPSLVNVLRIAEALGVKLEKLL